SVYIREGPTFYRTRFLSRVATRSREFYGVRADFTGPSDRRNVKSGSGDHQMAVSDRTVGSPPPWAGVPHGRSRAGAPAPGGSAGRPPPPGGRGRRRRPSARSTARRPVAAATTPRTAQPAGRPSEADGRRGARPGGLPARRAQRHSCVG